MPRTQSNTVSVAPLGNKSGRGGYRPGAGRKKGSTNRLQTPKKPQPAQGIRLIGVKREKALWKLTLDIAEQTRNADQLIRALVHVNEIQRGRPYVATNPNAQPVQPQDNRLMMAIQNLQIVSQSPNQSSKTQVIESKAIPVLPSECQESSTDSDNQAPGDVDSSSEANEAE